jgi:DNA-binding FadR family transcriptional regulator
MVEVLFVSYLRIYFLNQHPLRQASNEYIADLGEFHSAILSHSAYLAAQRTTEYELNKIKELIDQFEQAVEADTCTA